MGVSLNNSGYCVLRDSRLFVARPEDTYAYYASMSSESGSKGKSLRRS